MKKKLTEDTVSDNRLQRPVGPRRQENLSTPATVGNQITDPRNDLAPKVKPFPLDKCDDVSVNAFISIANLKKLLETSLSNPAISKKHHNDIRKASRICTGISNALVEINRIVDKI